MRLPVVLSVGGSDSGAGGGIQADLKVFAALRTYGVSVVTAVTAQNTCTLADVYPVPGNVVAVQLNTVLEDMAVSATKVGMLAAGEIAASVTAKARTGALPNLVLDPVLESSSGRRVGLVAALERLLPYATVATPNREEASALLGWRVTTPSEMAAAAGQLASGGPRYVVVTGGDMRIGNEAVDVVWTDAGARFLRYPRIVTRNSYGTGCTFSAAIAARLALGDEPPHAIAYAKRYVARALVGARDWQVGAGHGPIDHFGWRVGVDRRA
ncbi:MAG TPA: bifunctional hydroxymethylpyrimidine kinase/phosphomethylpyrimidine kinase [Micromonosporaceae bacterium]|nr:bifunctional hydroxymethylpyrimidine kinase/phosphomethylpyrimidine kinase [Micromonosporaceae bacterium]